MIDAVTADFLPMLSAVAAPTRSLVVSVHDVAPETEAATIEILEQLKRVGIAVTSLLVVPDYHHAGKTIDDARFISRLRDLEADGHEIVIHGYYHERPRRDGERMRDKFLTRVYTAGEGEFFDLPYTEASRRISLARDEFRAAKLSPVGFIAPAWLLGDEAERAASDAGMQYTTRIGSILDFVTAEVEPARSLVYSTRAKWRQAASLTWNAALARAAEMRGLVRLSIHPPDFTVPEIRAQIVRLARRFINTRTATTYRDWIAQNRTAS